MSCHFALTHAQTHDFGPKPGYRGFVDGGYVIGVGHYDNNRLSFSTTHGYQFRPWLFAGAGLGCNFVGDAQFLAFPLFGDLRTVVPLGRFSPYFDLKMGYSFGDAEGFYLHPAIGCRIAATARTALNLSVGYELHRDDPYLGEVPICDCDDFGWTICRPGISIKLGLEF
ncbi:MAG: hypothetical protein IJR87_03270 [Bacteroidaceae bacterium]|nr:hypothetical protein [Bacteroidaceae bacterium]